MCGHVGAAGQLTVKHERVFKTMLILDSLRGDHSTGVAVVSRQGDVKLAKQVGDPFRLFDTKSFDRALQGFNCVMIGHNRYATQGKVNSANAHPFEFSKIVGAHNGTLTNKHVLDDARLFDVDSENLYHHMNKNGVEDTIHKLDGAWALVWFDKEEGKLNFIRNDKRPLFFAVVKNQPELLFWASEKWMLSVALSREELEVEEIREVPVDTWISLEVYDDGTLGKPHLTPLATKVVPPPVYDNNWRNNRLEHVYPIHNRNLNVAPAAAPVVKQPAPTMIAASGHVKDGADKNDPKSSIFTPSPYKAGLEHRLEVVSEAIDAAGSVYYGCKDREHPEQQIRLYKNRNDKLSMLGKFIFCNLHQFRYTDRTGAYHKVEYGSVRLDTDVKKEEKNVEHLYQNANGKLVPAAQWKKDHGTCGWCQGHVDPEQAFKFTTSGDALCHICADDAEVLQYVNVK